jgi:hypothetical protein
MAKIKFVGPKKVSRGQLKFFGLDRRAKPLSTFNHGRGTLGYGEPAQIPDFIYCF